MRLYKKDGSNVDPVRRERIISGTSIVRPGTDGAELIHDLKPKDTVRLNADMLLSGGLQLIGSYEWVIYKPRWGAFYHTTLEQKLGELGSDTLMVVGCNFPNCPRTTIYEASERDFRIIIAYDAISNIYDRGIEEMKNIGVACLTTDVILDKLAHDLD